VNAHPPAGWYPDPHVTGLERFWDGTTWTNAQRAPSGVSALIPIGYITALIMPLVGFVLGVVVVTRASSRTSRHGPWIIVLSIIAFTVIYLALRPANGTYHGL
jgi:hypothetical protein